MARSFKLTHEKLLEIRKEKLYDSPAWKHASGYVQAYIQGMLDQLWQDHYSTLRFGYVVDGQIMTWDEIRERYPDTWKDKCHLYENEKRAGNGTAFYPDPDPAKRKPF